MALNADRRIPLSSDDALPATSGMDSYDFEEHVRSLRALSECVNVPMAPETAPSARNLLLALNSADTDIVPRVFELTKTTV